MSPMKMQAGYSDKQAAKVLTVDQAKHRVECALRDGGIVYAAVWEIPAIFRWPKVGEVWTIRRDAGIWRLDGLLENFDIAESAMPLSELGEGQVRILATSDAVGSGVYINRLPAVRKAAFNIGDGVATTYLVEHSWGTPNITYSVLERGTGIYVDADVTQVDFNTLRVAFGVAPTTDQFRLTITG